MEKSLHANSRMRWYGACALRSILIDTNDAVLYIWGNVNSSLVIVNKYLFCVSKHEQILCLSNKINHRTRPADGPGQFYLKTMK